MKIVMLGAPGAGKGTQAKMIAAKYQITCQELSMLNPGDALSEINAGKTLRIPDR